MTFGPARLPLPDVPVNGDFRLAVQFLDRDGETPLDLTVSGVDVECRISKSGDSTSYSRKKSNSGETAYVTDGTDGKIEFIYIKSALATIATTEGYGEYDVEVFYLVAASSVERMMARGVVQITAGVT